MKKFLPWIVVAVVGLAGGLVTAEAVAANVRADTAEASAEALTWQLQDSRVDLLNTQRRAEDCLYAAESYRIAYGMLAVSYYLTAENTVNLANGTFDVPKAEEAMDFMDASMVAFDAGDDVGCVYLEDGK